MNVQPYNRNVSAAGLLALACMTPMFFGCSGDAGNAGRRPGIVSMDMPASAAGVSGGTGDIHNPGPGMVIAGVGASGASGTGSMMTPNTALTPDPIAIDECGAGNQAGLSPEDVARLKAGGSPDGLRPLYPYDGTVFPRGMLAPDVMWDGAAADAVYIHIKSAIFEYWGCLLPTSPNRITLSQDAWERAGERSRGKDDFYEIELSVLSLGSVIGPIKWKVQVAQAAIKGSIYYNTYSTGLIAGTDPGGGFGLPGFPGGGGIGIGGSNGVVVRIPAGGSAEIFGQTDCNGCHSVSADGSRLLAQSVAAGTYSYQLSSTGAVPPPTMAANGAWSAVYPDGSAFLSMSTVVDVARTSFFGGASGTNATLYDSTTGQPITSAGIPPGTLMPFFSPDGTHLVFNDYAIGDAHGIALMRYDVTTHTATDYQMIYSEPAGAMRPAWPFVLPDNHGVVFVRTDDFSFTGGGVGVSGPIAFGAAAPYSELSVLDLDTKTVTLLARAMGYNTAEDAAQGISYLPFGAEDSGHAYYPTVSPVAAGGYFWVFFDSVRHYGNLGLQRQLWGSAINIDGNGNYGSDPSFPAFYLSGQEFGTGNHRAFAALDPCRKDGDDCTSGIDCCGGYCYTNDPTEEFGVVAGQCSPPQEMCAKRDDRCTSNADCCPPDNSGPANTCIAGFCAFIRSPQ